MTPTDLHAAVHAAVTARLDFARAATPGPWLSDPTGTVVVEADLKPDERFGGEPMLPDTGPREVAECYRNERPALVTGGPSERAANAAHIAANDPAATIRACEADLERLGGTCADRPLHRSASRRGRPVARSVKARVPYLRSGSLRRAGAHGHGVRRGGGLMSELVFTPIWLFTFGYGQRLRATASNGRAGGIGLPLDDHYVRIPAATPRAGPSDHDRPVRRHLVLRPIRREECSGNARAVSDARGGHQQGTRSVDLETGGDTRMSGADYRDLSVALERETGCDSIPTIETHYQDYDHPGRYRCCFWRNPPGCKTATRDAQTMWLHVHFTKRHGLSFGVTDPDELTGRTTMQPDEVPAPMVEAATQVLLVPLRHATIGSAAHTDIGELATALARLAVAAALSVCDMHPPRGDRP